MSTPMFEHFGDEVTFCDREDLFFKLDSLNIYVPRRPARDAEKREVFCLDVYLRLLARQGLLKYPLKISKREQHISPDFFIDQEGDITGLEHTNASTPEYELALSQLTNHHRACVEDCFFKYGSSLSMRDAVKAIREEDEPYCGPGWQGDQPKETWIIIMLKAINNKTKKLNAGHYEPANTYELLLYDLSPASIHVNFQDMISWIRIGISIFREVTEFPKHFDKISIVNCSEMLYDVGSKPKLFRP